MYSPFKPEEIMLRLFLVLILCGLIYADPKPDALSANALPVTTAASGMTMTQAVVLGVVEGITEYLPISSTGHLLLAEHFLGMSQQKEAADAYAICIQAGAILAVIVLYFGRVRSMVLGFLGQDKGGLKLSLLVISAFLPAAVIGLIFNKKIKAALFGLEPIVIAWLIGGIVILIFAWKDKKEGQSLETLSLGQAVSIGFLQVIAMCPGISRSLMTIMGGRLVGLSMAASVEFSFLLGLLTLTAATCYEGLKSGHLILSTYGVFYPLVGFVVAFLSALVAVRWMVSYLNRKGLAIFGWYRIVLAILVYFLILRTNSV